VAMLHNKETGVHSWLIGVIILSNIFQFTANNFR